MTESFSFIFFHEDDALGLPNRMTYIIFIVSWFKKKKLKNDTGHMNHAKFSENKYLNIFDWNGNKLFTSTLIDQVQ